MVSPFCQLCEQLGNAHLGVMLMERNRFGSNLKMVQQHLGMPGIFSRNQDQPFSKAQLRESSCQPKLPIGVGTKYKRTGCMGTKASLLLQINSPHK